MNFGMVALISSSGSSIRLPNLELHARSHVHIRAETPQLGLAAAFAMFHVASDQIRHLGYDVEQLEAPSQVSKAAYVSPTPRAELSRFTATVKAEIELSRSTLTAETVEQLLSTLRIGPLLSRRPDELSGGETAKVLLAGHILRMPQVLILDRVLEELDQYSRGMLLAFLRQVPWDMVVVTIGGESPIALPVDAVVVVDHQRAVLQTAELLSVFVEADVQREALVMLTEYDRKTSRPIAIASGIKIVRGTREILAGYEFTLRAGDVHWLLGANGSGKSSLLEAICGLIPTAPPSQFEIFRKEERMGAFSLASIAAYSPQDPDGDITELTLLEEVCLALQASTSGQVSVVQAEAWLNSRGVPANVGALSLTDDVQNRKLASVLAAFSRGRPLVLLDEPTLFLDTKGQDIVAAAVAAHTDQGGVVICATHDTTFRAKTSSRVKQTAGTEEL